MKERRIKEEIYMEILAAIQNQTNGDPPKLTNVQLAVKVSYDKVKLYCERLEKYDLLTLKRLRLTSKGSEFVKYFRTFFTDFQNMKQTFFSDDDSWKNLPPVILWMPPSKYDNLSSSEVKDLYQQINNLNATIELLEEQK